MLKNFTPACNFIKKRLQHKCFTVKFAKLLKKPLFAEHLQWLLLALVAFFLKYASEKLPTLVGQISLHFFPMQEITSRAWTKE